jgi:membrane-associated HD superfamily phosphohydrolase
VAEGIVSHHGDGIMRYFYEKARQADGDGVDPDLFRHAGHKPQTREMAIIMMSDAVEGACRAIFADEESRFGTGQALASNSITLTTVLSVATISAWLTIVEWL